jgi:hypothetical protein
VGKGEKSKDFLSRGLLRLKVKNCLAQRVARILTHESRQHPTYDMGGNLVEWKDFVCVGKGKKSKDFLSQGLLQSNVKSSLVQGLVRAS